MTVHRTAQTHGPTTRKAVCNRIWRLMRSYDLLLTPTLAVPPFPLYTQEPEIIDGRMVAPTQWLCFTFPLNPMNMTGQPAATVPAGFTQDGLPVGLQIIGGASGRSIGPAGLCRLRGRPALSFSVCTMPRLRRLLRHDPTFFSVSRTSRALETLNLRSVMTLRPRLRSHGAASRLRFGWTARWSIRRIMASVTMASDTSGSCS